jgi:hypothetical protein
MKRAINRDGVSVHDIKSEKHDLIYIEFTQRWVCKCGKAGHNESGMLEHQAQIQAEIDIKKSNLKSVDDLINEVETVHNR